MPIFEYACRTCGKEFETLVRGASAAPRCPACHSAELTKKLSAFAPRAGSAPAAPPPGACASCGNPDGPGACRFN
ncbi:MAG: hypothetical protein Fur0039_05430 [Rhodocyclaceae bacterium]